MGTKNNPGQFDCYSKAEPDEPVFVLLGRDKHAPTLVWLWATLRELDREDAAVVKEARDAAMAMIEWQVEQGRKPVGFAQGTMAGLLELIRTVNGLIDKTGITPQTRKTDLDVARAFLAGTKVAFD